MNVKMKKKILAIILITLLIFTNYSFVLGYTREGGQNLNNIARIIDDDIYLDGEYNMYGIRVRDGFCFTKTSIEGKESEDCIDGHDKVEAMRIVYTTYMNESGMSNTQRAAIEKEHFEVLKRYMSEFMGISDTDMSVRGKM